MVDLREVVCFVTGREASRERQKRLIVKILLSTNFLNFKN